MKFEQLVEKINDVTVEDYGIRVGESFIDAHGRVADSFEGNYDNKITILELFKDTVTTEQQELYSHILFAMKALTFIDAYFDDVEDVVYDTLGVYQDDIDDDYVAPEDTLSTLSQEVTEFKNSDIHTEDNNFNESIIKLVLLDALQLKFANWL